MSVNVSTATSSNSFVATLTQLPADALPATYLETDRSQRSQARIAHLCGIFGIVGTGIYYLVKRNDSGPFVRDQAKESFNFQMLAFVVATLLRIVAILGGSMVGMIATVFGLASLAVMLAALVLSIMNAMKAGKGEVARYPARVMILK